MAYQLNNDLINDVFKVALRNKDFFHIMLDNLKYQYLPMEEQKMVLRTIKNHYDINATIPSISILKQKFPSGSDKDVAVIDVLDKIQDKKFPNINDTMREFELFIKDSMSLIEFDKVITLFNEGKTDESRQAMQKAGEKLSKFSILNTTIKSKSVFGGFENRHYVRELKYNTESYLNDKVPFSIDAIDAMTNGGIDVTDTFCLLARSGVGKTKFLRHVAVGASRRRKVVLHIQAEGSEESCLRGYDATWTGVLMSDIRKGSIPDDKYKELMKITRKIRSQGGEIYVHAFEQFASATIADVRHLAYELLKSSPIDLIIIDYLELLEPSDGRKYSVSEERHRRLSIANSMKNIALELGTRVGTATQANSISQRDIENPDFVMTRHNVSEAKAIVNPFSYFFTANQTPEEYEEGVMRLYADKFRDYKSSKIFTIYQAYEYDRFYDRKRTLANTVIDEDNKEY